MFRPQIVCEFAIFISTIAFVSASDDVQVIRSEKSVLSIYTYGTAARSRVAPEIPDSSRTNRSAALTDVIANPPLSSSVRNPSSRPASGSPNAVLTATPASSQTTSPSAITKTPRTATVQPTVTEPTAPSPRTVTFSWQPSPDAGVIGYRVYVGNAQRDYSLDQTVDNQTTATVTLSDDAVYLAVTAYTVEGLESVFSDVLSVASINPATAPFSGASGANRN